MKAPKRILLVDDEKEFLFAAGLALRQAGYDVDAFANPREAIGRVLDAGRENGPFDLLVTDLQMPVMSGGELVQALRENRIFLHVLTISGVFAKTIPCTMDCSCGVNHLDKPFEPRELVERVERILG